MLKRVTVTLPSLLATELESLRLTERISVSSVAEIALRAYLNREGKGAAVQSLRAAGATLRRRRGSSGSAILREENEEARLGEVRRYDILDTPPDGAYDSLTELAARIFDVPIALVTVVDEDRIWFKSRFGLDDVEQIARDPGLCSSAICRDDVYIVESARQNVRTLANPLVAGELGLQFYAAAPLTTAEGFRLGTFCILDRKPREMTSPEVNMLQTFADLVMADLELRMQAMTLIAEERRLRNA